MYVYISGSPGHKACADWKGQCEKKKSVSKTWTMRRLPTAPKIRMGQMQRTNVAMCNCMCDNKDFLLFFFFYNAMHIKQYFNDRESDTLNNNHTTLRLPALSTVHGFQTKLDQMYLRSLFFLFLLYLLCLFI